MNNGLRRPSPWDPAVGMPVFKNTPAQSGIITAIVSPGGNGLVPQVQVRWRTGRVSNEDIRDIGDIDKMIAQHQAVIDDFQRARAEVLALR